MLACIDEGKIVRVVGLASSAGKVPGLNGMDAPFPKRHQGAKVEVLSNHFIERERHHGDYDNRD
jgi:hypothetical protein